MCTDFRCAVERFKKSPKCYACGAATSGMFNKAEKILAKLEAKNKRIKEAKGEEEPEGDSGIQFGGGDSDDEDGEGGDGGVADQSGGEASQDEDD